MLLVYLDPFHLGDPLFLSRFARNVRAYDGPVVLLHGSGEEGERVLEMQGLVPERRGGVLMVQSAEELALVERAVRDLNRRIVHALNEEGVAAVRVMGNDRRLLRLQDGQLETGSVGWVAKLAHQHAVPVVAAWAAGEKGSQEADPVAAVSSLAQALAAEREAVAVWLLQGGFRPGEDEAMVEQLSAAGVPVVVAPAGALREADPRPDRPKSP